jgi:hypothetical protein
MPITIASYYIDELANWSDSISFYEDEMEGIEEKFIAVIRRNSILDIAGKVEVHQAQLNLCSEKFYKLILDIEQQDEALTTDDTLVEDFAINNKIEKRQTDMRRKMQEVEKEYIDVRFECQSFLSEILKPKKTKP